MQSYQDLQNLANLPSLDANYLQQLQAQMQKLQGHCQQQNHSLFSTSNLQNLGLPLLTGASTSLPLPTLCTKNIVNNNNNTLIPNNPMINKPKPTNPNPLPNLTSSQLHQMTCLICNDRATGLHYGVVSCEGCKGFFKRSICNKRVYKCNRGGNCEMTRKQRNRCQFCRLKKCLIVGMNRKAIREDGMPGGRNKNIGSVVMTEQEIEFVLSGKEWEVLAQQGLMSKQSSSASLNNISPKIPQNAQVSPQTNNLQLPTFSQIPVPNPQQQQPHQPHQNSVQSLIDTYNKQKLTVAALQKQNLELQKGIQAQKQAQMSLYQNVKLENTNNTCSSSLSNLQSTSGVNSLSPNPVFGGKISPTHSNSKRSSSTNIDIENIEQPVISSSGGKNSIYGTSIYRTVNPITEPALFAALKQADYVYPQAAELIDNLLEIESLKNLETLQSFDLKKCSSTSGNNNNDLQKDELLLILAKSADEMLVRQTQWIKSLVFYDKIHEKDHVTLLSKIWSELNLLACFTIFKEKTIFGKLGKCDIVLNDANKSGSSNNSSNGSSGLGASSSSGTSPDQSSAECASPTNNDKNEDSSKTPKTQETTSETLTPHEITLIQRILTLFQKMNSLKIDNEEYVIMKVINYLNQDTENLQSPQTIEEINKLYWYQTQNWIEMRYKIKLAYHKKIHLSTIENMSGLQRFKDLMLCLPEIRLVSNLLEQIQNPLDRLPLLVKSIIQAIHLTTENVVSCRLYEENSAVVDQKPKVEVKQEYEGMGSNSEGELKIDESEESNYHPKVDLKRKRIIRVWGVEKVLKIGQKF